MRWAREEATGGLRGEISHLLRAQLGELVTGASGQQSVHTKPGSEASAAALLCPPQCPVDS